MEKDELAVTFGTNVRSRRKEVGLSQDRLALVAEIDRSYMGRIERGEVNITLKMVYQLANCLDTNAKSLLP